LLAERRAIPAMMESLVFPDRRGLRVDLDPTVTGDGSKFGDSRVSYLYQISSQARGASDAVSSYLGLLGRAIVARSRLLSWS
jgi:hypothetical protein